MSHLVRMIVCFFFLNDRAPTEIYPLPLHAALPIGGAPEGLGVFYPGGFVGRRFCYPQRGAAAPADRHETLRLIHVLSAWQIAAPGSAEIEQIGRASCRERV